jgi:hypothetical protein
VETKTMKEYEQAKHRIGRIVLFEKLVDKEEFTTRDFYHFFKICEERYGIVVRTPNRPNTRSGGWSFLSWSDRIGRLLKHYCDHIDRGKWRVNLRKKAWNLFEGGN